MRAPSMKAGMSSRKEPRGGVQRQELPARSPDLPSGTEAMAPSSGRPRMDVNAGSSGRVRGEIVTECSGAVAGYGKSGPKVRAGKCAPESARRKVRAGKCAPESARRKVRALDRPNRATYNRSPGSRVPMFTSTHGPRGREPLRPDAPSATGESSVTRLSRFTDVPRLTLHFMRDMMLPTLCYDSQSILGFSPRTREACVDAAGIMSAADATGNRSERYRTAGIGRGGYAP